MTVYKPPGNHASGAKDFPIGSGFSYFTVPPGGQIPPSKESKS